MCVQEKREREREKKVHPTFYLAISSLLHLMTKILLVFNFFDFKKKCNSFSTKIWVEHFNWIARNRWPLDLWPWCEVPLRLNLVQRRLKTFIQLFLPPTYYIIWTRSAKHDLFVQPLAIVDLLTSQIVTIQSKEVLASNLPQHDWIPINFTTILILK